MKLALVIPDSPFLISPRTFPNLGPLYLSSALKQVGHEAEVIDLTGGVELPRINADMIGITITTPHFGEAVKILSHIKQRNPQQRVVAGGPHVSVDPNSCLIAGFDQVVKGEGEKAIIKVADGNEDTVVEMPFIEDLDTIPFPAREAIDIHSYHYHLNGARTTSMMTSRGCPFNCAFCCRGAWGRSVRFRSSENVLKEVAELKSIGFDGINFYDDNLLVQKGRDWRIFAGLKKMRMVYRCFTRSKLLDEDSVEMMAKTGCVEVLLGIESGSNRILKNIDKGETREDHLRAITLLKKWGIRVKAACIVGLPGESWESVHETESLIEEAQPSDVDFTICTVYPGSPIAVSPNGYDIKVASFYSPYKTAPGQYRSGVSTSYMTAEEIVKARDLLEAKFKRQELLR